MTHRRDFAKQKQQFGFSAAETNNSKICSQVCFSKVPLWHSTVVNSTLQYNVADGNMQSFSLKSYISKYSDVFPRSPRPSETGVKEVESPSVWPFISLKIKITSLNLLFLNHSIFNTQIRVRNWLAWFQEDFLSSSRVLGVRDLSPQQSFQVVEDEWVLHVHLSSVALESHTGVQLPLQLLSQPWRRPTQEVVLQRAARLCQVWLKRLLPAPFLRHITWRLAVHPVHAVGIRLTLQHPHGAFELVLGNHRPGVSQTELVTVGVTEVRRGEVADEEAAVGTVEDVLHQLQQTHGNLSFARPGGGEPLVHSALQAAGHPGYQRPG